MHFPTGNIETLLVGSNPDSFYTYPVPSAEFDLVSQVLVGNLRHGGPVTLADVRTPAYRKKQDVVLNRQAVSIVGTEDLDYLADGLELDEEVALQGLLQRFNTDTQTNTTIPPEYAATLEQGNGNPGALNRLFLAQCLGVNIVVSDFQGTNDTPNFRSLGRGIDVGPFDDTIRKFTPEGATVMITRPNAPCIGPGKLIEDTYGALRGNLAKDFVRLGQGRRGFVGMISKGGQMAVGQTLRFIPYGE